MSIWLIFNKLWLQTSLMLQSIGFVNLARKNKWIAIYYTHHSCILFSQQPLLFAILYCVVLDFFHKIFQIRISGYCTGSFKSWCNCFQFHKITLIWSQRRYPSIEKFNMKSWSWETWSKDVSLQLFCELKEGCGKMQLCVGYKDD